MRSVIGLALLAASLPAAAVAQDPPLPAGSSVSEIADVPFGLGERLDYRVKFGPLNVGEAFMEVEGLDSIAGHPTYHLRFHIRGGTFFYKLDDKQDSWLDVFLLATRRYEQDSKQGSYERQRQYLFDLEAGIRTRHDGESAPIPSDALDEAAFIYFVRTVPLEVGERYEWNRYYRADRNPVILEVLRRETVKVPAGEFETIVVRPIIKTRGIFSEGGEAEVYITDDERRIPVRLNSKMKVGSVTLELTGHREGERLTPDMLGVR
ncbi:MAG: DUF3108 domain-containing protein [Gemmatimonadota bacterium]|nr:MAG: DUF3108 domain-containing protein [Gemmatimonadota bacterium]